MKTNKLSELMEAAFQAECAAVSYCKEHKQELIEEFNKENPEYYIDHIYTYNGIYATVYRKSDDKIVDNFGRIHNGKWDFKH